MKHFTMLWAAEKCIAKAAERHPPRSAGAPMIAKNRASPRRAYA
jgi:hypothetical protein